MLKSDIFNKNSKNVVELNYNSQKLTMVPVLKFKTVQNKVFLEDTHVRESRLV